MVHTSTEDHERHPSRNLRSPELAAQTVGPAGLTVRDHDEPACHEDPRSYAKETKSSPHTESVEYLASIRYRLIAGTGRAHQKRPRDHHIMVMPCHHMNPYIQVV